MGSNGSGTSSSRRRQKGDGGATPRLLIACNGSATWAGIKIALGSAEIEVCGEIHDAADLADAVARLNPAVCLVDVELDNSLRHVAALASGPSRTAVIILTSADTELREDEFLAAMNAGAAGYLPTTISPQGLPAAVRAVLDGELAIPRALIPMLVDQLRRRNGRRHVVISPERTVALTPREWDVLELMREGLTTREIAARLLISEVTVRRHVGGILKKTQVQSRREALQLLQRA